MLFVFLPFITLLSFCIGVITVMLAVNNCARSAGPCVSYGDAQQVVQKTGAQIIGGLGAGSRLSPTDATGLVLSIQQIPLGGGSGNVYTPVAGKAPDVTNFFYVYQVTGTYKINPIFFPDLFKQPFTFTGNCTVEHPEGLNNGATTPGI
jgi:hypothetical protein